MPDIATIGAALGSIKTASDIAKLIKDSGSSLEEAEIKLQIAELIGALAEVKMELAGIQQELTEKDKFIQELQIVIDTKANVVYEKPYYFTEDDDERDGPFCQQCYDSENKLIRLQAYENGSWHCHTCDKRVKDSSYVKPVVRTLPRRSRF